MSGRKLEITDKTLVILDLIYGDMIRKKIPKLRELIKLIYEIGSDYIEITEDLYKELRKKVSTQLVAHGGAGTFEDIKNLFLEWNNRPGVLYYDKTPRDLSRTCAVINMAPIQELAGNEEFNFEDGGEEALVSSNSNVFKLIQVCVFLISFLHI